MTPRYQRFFAHFRAHISGRFPYVIDGNLRSGKRFIPNHDLRRNKADINDFREFVLLSLHNNVRLFNQIRRKERLLGF